MTLATQVEFAGFPESTEEIEASPLVQYLRLWDESGGLIPQAMLPDALGLSRARVCQFIAEERFDVRKIGGTNFVTAVSFEAFLAQERKTGRPGKTPSFRQCLKGARVAVDEWRERRKKK